MRENERWGSRPSKGDIARRLKQVRLERYGKDGGCEELARELGLPSRTRLNHESGVTAPGEVIFHFLELTGAETMWPLWGEGPMYRPEGTTVERGRLARRPRARGENEEAACKGKLAAAIGRFEQRFTIMPEETEALHRVVKQLRPEPEQEPRKGSGHR